MSETATGSITTEISDGLQVIRMMRSEKKNALTQDMYAALTKAFTSCDENPAVKVHVLFGSGGVFSAGNDIGDFLSHTAGGQKIDASAPVLQFLSALTAIEKPIVAGVDGPAIGVGTTMLFHFDLVYATPNAIFHTPFIDLGLVPEAASSLLMPQRMGYARAFEMLVLGQPKTADHMREYGLINGVVASDDLEHVTLKAAEHLAAKPQSAVAIARRLMRGNRKPIRDQMAEENKAFVERLSSDEARQAFTAFLSKSQKA